MMNMIAEDVGGGSGWWWMKSVVENMGLDFFHFFVKKRKVRVLHNPRHKHKHGNPIPNDT